MNSNYDNNQVRTYISEGQTDKAIKYLLDENMLQGIRNYKKKLDKEL